jgi:serine/threonine-protein kinase HipA
MTNSQALIFKKGVLAASLTRQASSIEFKYDDTYLASDAPAVATTLPKSPSIISLSGGAAPAYFAGLLPEGRRLSAIVSRLGTSLDDDLSVLLEIGADVIGDVQILQSGASASAARDVLMLPIDLSEVSFEELRDRYFGSRASGLPGVQDKVSSKMLNTRARMANMDYILKLNPAEVPFAVENEAFFLKLARSCEIQTANFKVLTDKGGKQALLLERFDRIASKTGTRRMAQEDGCQVMNAYPAAKYNVDFIEMSQSLIGTCPAGDVASYELFKQLVFSWLIGNGDAHAKNFSILESTSGEWRISPAYDLLCTRFYEDRGSRDMALAVGGSTSGWTRTFLLDAATKLGVLKHAAAFVIDFQLKQLKDLPEQILHGALPFRRDQNIEVADFLKRRSRALA